MILACVLSLVGFLDAANLSAAQPVEVVAVAAAAPSAHPSVENGRWPVGGVVRMFALMAAGALAMALTLAVTSASLLAGARFASVRDRHWLGTDVLLGLGGLAAFTAVVSLLLASGSSVVCALWWLAELTSS